MNLKHRREELEQQLAEYNTPSLFETGKPQKDEKESLIERLYQQIGQLQVEVDWMRKKGLSIWAKNEP